MIYIYKYNEFLTGGWTSNFYDKFSWKHWKLLIDHPMKVSRCPSTETSPCVKLWDPRFGHSERSGLMRSFGSFLHETCGWASEILHHQFGMVETCWNPINHGINHLSTGDNRISLAHPQVSPRFHQWQLSTQQNAIEPTWLCLSPHAIQWGHGATNQSTLW